MAPKRKAAVKSEAAAESAAAEAPAQAKKVRKEDSEASPAVKAVSSAPATSGVHVTSSKACQAFGKHVDKLKEALGKLRPGVAVEVDTQPKEGKNPDRGSFVVVVNGKTVVELRAMPRPFTAMKGLDMDDVARKVVAAL
jgi:hypothetical protein